MFSREAYKTRLSKRLRTGTLDELVLSNPEDDADIIEDELNVVRKKQVSLKPVSVEEAILQMEMTNHKFFMFLNAETGDINVVYVRDDGAYGLLEPFSAG